MSIVVDAAWHTSAPRVLNANLSLWGSANSKPVSSVSCAGDTNSYCYCSRQRECILGRLETARRMIPLAVPQVLLRPRICRFPRWPALTATRQISRRCQVLDSRLVGRFREFFTRRNITRRGTIIMYTCYMHTQTTYGINAVTRYAHFDAITCNSHDPCCLSFAESRVQLCSAAAPSTILSSHLTHISLSNYHG